jgi:hypothetical protein
MSKKKLKISKGSFKKLKKICKINGFSDEYGSFNDQVEHLIYEEKDRLDNPMIAFDERRKSREIIEKELLVTLREVALKEGIILPDESLFQSADDLKVFLVLKLLINNTAIEKMCNKFLPLYEKLPLAAFGESISAMMNMDAEPTTNV